MKIGLTGTVEKRPYPSSSWIVLALPALIIFVGVNLLLWQSQLGRVILLLAKVAIHLIPPFIWLGGGAIVALWLLVLRRVW
ncbi:MAG: hypothetical protein CL608_21450 [Anaerolineaceae bacterium]|nr:hypothetical protein [Anaerolineaceae bacterium]